LTYQLNELAVKFPFESKKYEPTKYDDSETSFQVQEINRIDFKELLTRAYRAAGRSLEIDRS
jgi:hypothetical protein